MERFQHHAYCSSIHHFDSNIWSWQVVDCVIPDNRIHYPNRDKCNNVDNIYVSFRFIQ